MANAVRYYFLAPTWHNHPKSGSIQLGNILTDLHAPERPVHRGPPPPPQKLLDAPPDPNSGEMTESWQTSYEFSTEKLKSGKYGIWTKFLSFLGLGVDLGYEWDSSVAQTYSFDRLETTEFNPSDDYIEKCLAAPPVARLVRQKQNTFYIITGIKAVTGASVKTSRSKGHKVAAGIEVDGSVIGGGIPVSLGPEVKDERSSSEGTAWAGSSDFVFAYRVQKIKISRMSGEVSHKNHVTGALLGRNARTRSLNADTVFTISGLEEDSPEGQRLEVEDAGDGEKYAQPLKDEA